MALAVRILALGLVVVPCGQVRAEGCRSLDAQPPAPLQATGRAL